MRPSVVGVQRNITQRSNSYFDWIKFNPGLFALYRESAAVRSDDVNYAI